MPRARRILYLIDSLGTGGAERGLFLTLKYIDRTRFEPEVAYLWPPSSAADGIRKLGIEVHNLGGRRGPRAFLTLPAVVRLLRRGGFDAIHTQVLWASIVGRIAGKLAGVKVISYVLNVDPGGVERRESQGGVVLKSLVLGALDNSTGRFLTDQFVAISESVRRDPIRGSSWKTKNFAVVTRGQDLEELAHRASLDPQPPIPDPGSPSILAVGQLRAQKGYRYLLAAMPKVIGRYPHAKLLVAGGGYLADDLRRAADPSGGSVEWLGIRSDVPALLSRCDVFVFASLWEGQGNALVEAMAVGGPIVATRIPAIEETIRDEDTGILVPPANSEALAEGILRILSDPAASAEMSRRASRAALRFDIHATTRSLETVYTEVLAG